jgi:integrase
LGDRPPAPQPAVPALPAEPPGRGALDLARLSPEARALIAGSLAPETARAYGYHWRVFERWCARRGIAALPSRPEAVADYLAFRAAHGVPADESAQDQKRDDALRAEGDGYVPRRTYAERWQASMVNQAVAAIRLVHEANGLDMKPRDHFPVRKVLRGIARLGGRVERKAPISTEDLRAAFSALGDDLRGRRDRALLGIGFAAALRRGELAALEVHDVREDSSGKGIVLALRRHFSGAAVVPGTKANPGGKVEELVGVALGEHEESCPVRALRAWLEAASITAGRIFRAVRRNAVGKPLTPQSVALVVKRAVSRIGLDPEAYGGHSLRAGLATSAHEAGKSLPAIGRQGRWKRYDTLLGYIRAVGVFDENASEGIGL